MTRPRLWVELCCGSAAVTLRLLGGRYAVPPISYMGSKRGYATAILGAMGLRSGIGADRVVLCDAGPWAHVWGVLADPGRCAEVAATLRGWADEEPRELWDRLREEHRGEWDGWTAERAAGWIYVRARTHRTGDGFAPERDERPGRTGFQGCGPDRVTLAHRVESVAAWLYAGHFSYRGGYPESGFCPSHTRDRPRTATDHGGNRRTPETVVGNLDTVPDSGLQVYSGSAADVPIPDNCDGVCVYIDPDYQWTTGYAHTFPRAAVLATAHRWSDAGAVVCVSEAVPLGLDGWYHVEITGAREGQKRTFSRQQSEWLTLNRPPAHVPAVQVDLW